jgi:hypothetical protein
VIPRIHKRGTSVAGLLYYLFGPGRHEEHTNPHLIAAWHGAGDLTGLQPPHNADGKHSMKQLINLLEQPVHAGRRPPDKTVWHCSIRNHPTDRTLTDQQWQHIAGEIMAAVGLAPHHDPHAVRWIAVRHAHDHIHLVATLVRQDGTTAWAWNDRLKARTAAIDLEQRYGLHRTAPADRTTHRRPGAAELNKSRRQHQNEVPRDRLRRDVRAAAAAATSEADFLDHLRSAGVLVKLRTSSINPEEITGYAVGLPGHRTAAGATVWYSGGRLAPDLTLPKLRHRWTGNQPPDPQPTPRHAEAFQQAAHIAAHAADELKHLTTTDPQAATAIAAAAADLLTTTARTTEGHRGGPLTDAAEAFDRAARQPHGRPPPRNHHADQLRAMSRLIATTGRLTSDHRTTAALHLVLHLSALAEHLADLRDAQGRFHQARDARHAARQLHTITQGGRSGASSTRLPTVTPPMPSLSPRGSRTSRPVSPSSHH